MTVGLASSAWTVQVLLLVSIHLHEIIVIVDKELKEFKVRISWTCGSWFGVSSLNIINVTIIVVGYYMLIPAHLIDSADQSKIRASVNQSSSCDQ